jgi:hypothetical protein
LGWNYQIEPDEDYNEIIIHIRFKETDVRLQQETLGILGVFNLPITNTMIPNDCCVIYTTI